MARGWGRPSPLNRPHPVAGIKAPPSKGWGTSGNRLVSSRMLSRFITNSMCSCCRTAYRRSMTWLSLKITALCSRAAIAHTSMNSMDKTTERFRHCSVSTDNQPSWPRGFGPDTAKRNRGSSASRQHRTESFPSRGGPIPPLACQP
jgi:hypothetical protein